MIKKIIYKLYEHHINKKFHNPYGMAFEYFKDYKNHKLAFYKIFGIHKKGFTVEDWCFCGINKSNYKEYLSTAQYCSLHPFNNDFNKWIDDKLTLKYLCHGTSLDKYLPRYYFMIDANGLIIPLVDSLKKQIYCDPYDVLDVLIKNGELAFKKIAGQCGEGFYKASYFKDNFFINGEKNDKQQILEFIKKLKNYIIIEFLHPHKTISKYCSNTTNTIRYLVGRYKNEIINIKSYVRFGTKKSKYVDNYAAGGVLCYLDNLGHATEGNIRNDDAYCNKKIKVHPDNNEELLFNIPFWDEIKNASDVFMNYFPQIKYMGLDFVVTDKNEVKILEINSLTSLDALQMEGPFTGKSKLFYEELLNKLL